MKVSVLVPGCIRWELLREDIDMGLGRFILRWEWMTIWKNTIDAKHRRCSRDFHPREDIRLETLNNALSYNKLKCASDW